MIRKLLVALAATTSVVAFASYAEANTYMCAPDASGAQTGPRSVTTVTTSPTTYSLNGRGCGMINGPDVGYFLSQGFVVSPSGGAVSMFMNGPIASPATPSVTMPPRSFIEAIVVNNGGNGSVSGGGMALGTAQSGTPVGDVVQLISATALETNIALTATPFVLVDAVAGNLKSVSPTTVINPVKRYWVNGGTIFATTTGSWGSLAAPASVTVTIFYSQF